ncbi:hypothetical protein TPHA_0A05440 [Tetrapisispora phaffii CBS 4417]|uniref:Alpha/beta hydrolase fold-3 domain-containing protein n=1 Tax=Tetrapisispora phaffii (strain ATCC 24235 / CBS 4417 / NBRC 1672 / NRRL Y-8282 / UCD 70-5) TaxID=1071381 RepID=G8BNZ0_TETPH|nr:hypothetical protein TPHA_0A05440 [Tetrapisispora phaffii CBS 4417]CCE61618.1 hypothetical protein TPHA_0A05440 [Tetrapisispora phaffii CBS 4417]
MFRRPRVFFKESIAIMNHHGIIFLLKIIFILPFKLAIESYKLKRSNNEKPKTIDLDVFSRIFMREAFLLADKYSGEQVLNPLFVGLQNIMKYLLNSSKYPSEILQCNIINIKTDIFNESIINRSDIKSRFEWLSKPEFFNPKEDPVILYFHGGGFAIEMLPFFHSFLRNIARHNEKTAIAISHYTVTTSNVCDEVYPIPTLESIVLYKHFSDALGCKNISLMGESAGGHIILSLIQYLQFYKLQLPKHAVAVSPWLNPGVVDDDERQFMRNNCKLDSLSYEGLDLFQKQYIPNKNLRSTYNSDPLLNIETNFDSIAWEQITQNCKLYITYGSDEILRLQIDRFIKKLDKTCPNFIMENNVLIDHNGGHIRPIMNLHKDYNKWLRSELVQKLVNALGV